MLILLRLLVSALNPYREKGKSAAVKYRNKSVWFRFRYQLFAFSVKCMQYFYHRYAYCDSIELQNIKILHSCRDWEYERWLKLIGIDVKSHLGINKTDVLIDKGSHSSMPFGSFFRFERQCSVIQNNEKIVVNHCPVPCLYSEIAGTFKKSCSSDILIWTEFKSNPKSPMDTYVTKNINSHPEDRPTARHKVSIGKITSPHIEAIVTDSPQSKKMRGVEIDESF